MNGARYQWILVVWTLGIWGSRVRNIVVDDELDGADRIISTTVALTLIAAAVAVGVALRTAPSWGRSALLVLVAVGIVRWTIRGPLILASDEWELGFKTVHTILWLVTVLLSAMAWRERRGAEAR